MEQKKDIPGGEQISGERITVAGFQEKTVRHVKTLVRCEYQKTKDVTIPVHSHPGCAELTYHKWGRQRYEVDGRIYDIHAGDMFLAYPDELHSSGPYPEERSGFYYLLFEFPPDAEDFMGLSPEESDWIRQTLLSCRDRRKFRGTPEIPRLLNRILDIYENDDSSMQDCRIRALLIQFFYLVCRSIRQSGGQGDVQDRSMD